MGTTRQIKIVIDSSTDLSEETLKLVEVVPLTVTIGDESFRDGIDLSRDEFYTRLESSDFMPKTSQATPAVFDEVYTRLKGEDTDILVIAISSELSGTYESARMAAEAYPEVKVVDSRSATIGVGILVEHALQCIDEGMEIDELVAELEAARERVCVLATVDTLEYLVRGGRLSKVAGFAGGLLNIRPVIAVEDGVVKVLGKARGPKNANNLLTEEVEKRGADYGLPIMLGYSGTSDRLLQKYIRNHEDLWHGHVDELQYAQVCSVIGTHVGPGAVAVAFFEA